MSRTIAEKRSAGESFSGVLDRMALDRLDGDRVTLSARDPDQPVRTNPSRQDAARRPSAALARAMAGETAAVRRASEPVQLSYEKALQRHSRRRPLDEMPEPPGQPVSLPRETPGEAQKSTRGGLAKGGPAKASHAKSGPAKSSPARRVSGSLHPQPAKVPPIAAVTETSSKRVVSLPKRTSAAKTTLPRRPNTRKLAEAPANDSTTKALHARRKAKIRVADASRRDQQADRAKAKQAQTRASHPNRKSAIKGEATGPVVAAIRQLAQRAEQHDLQRIPGSALEQVREQRREIISVRLSEDESIRLRQRAAESGISVSAYMRSCVLEADHLRTQVKAALAEMRSITRSGARPSESRELAEFHAGGDIRVRQGMSWPGFFSKAAALLLGSWLHFGRRV